MTVVGNSRENQYGENHKTDVLIHQQQRDAGQTGMHSTKTERKQNWRKKWTWKIERDIGLQNEVKEEREKPELYVIQS